MSFASSVNSLIPTAPQFNVVWTVVCAVWEIEKSRLFRGVGRGWECFRDTRKSNFTARCLNNFVAQWKVAVWISQFGTGKSSCVFILVSAIYTVKFNHVPLFGTLSILEIKYLLFLLETNGSNACFLFSVNFSFWLVLNYFQLINVSFITLQRKPVARVAETFHVNERQLFNSSRNLFFSPPFQCCQLSKIM